MRVALALLCILFWPHRNPGGKTVREKEKDGRDVHMQEAAQTSSLLDSFFTSSTVRCRPWFLCRLVYYPNAQSNVAPFTGRQTSSINATIPARKLAAWFRFDGCRRLFRWNLTRFNVVGQAASPGHSKTRRFLWHFRTGLARWRPAKPSTLPMLASNAWFIKPVPALFRASHRYLTDKFRETSCGIQPVWHACMTMNLIVLLHPESIGEWTR